MNAATGCWLLKADHGRRYFVLEGQAKINFILFLTRRGIACSAETRAAWKKEKNNSYIPVARFFALLLDANLNGADLLFVPCSSCHDPSVCFNPFHRVAISISIQPALGLRNYVCTLPCYTLRLGPDGLFEVVMWTGPGRNASLLPHQLGQHYVALYNMRPKQSTSTMRHFLRKSWRRKKNGFLGT